MRIASASRVGAICSILGVGLLVIGTYHHPMEADPNVPAAAFAEYAADTLWVASHLTQLVGVTSMVVALLLFADNLKSSGGTKFAKIAAAGAITSLALAAALQAVDGIALLAERAYPKWFGWLAIIGGLPTGGAGVAIAYTGFSGLSMAINMPANILLLIWMLVLGVFMWRQR